MLQYSQQTLDAMAEVKRILSGNAVTARLQLADRRIKEYVENIFVVFGCRGIVMNEAIVVKTILLSVFFIGGVLLVLLGILIWRKLWGNRSVEVEAECIDVDIHTEAIGTGIDRTYFPNAKRPVYQYYYEGRQYTSSPLLASNRPGYKPAQGYCIIRINPKHPEKIYSPERKFVALILIIIGVAWIFVAVGAAYFLPI